MRGVGEVNWFVEDQKTIPAKEMVECFTSRCVYSSDN